MADYQGENFKKYLQSHNLSVEYAAEKLGKNKVTVYQYFRSKSLSREVVSNILTAFNVSLEDIFGNNSSHNIPRIEAEPLRLADPHGFDATGEKFYELPDGSLIMQVPIVPHRAQMGYLRGFADPEFYGDLPTLPLPVDKRHSGTYLAFETRGDSMVNISTPELAERSIFPKRIAVGREVPKHQWQYKLHINSNDYWIIVHKTEGILMKEIIDHNVDSGIITIHSLNPDYPDKEIQLNDVEQIFNVLQIVSKTR